MEHPARYLIFLQCIQMAGGLTEWAKSTLSAETRCGVLTFQFSGTIEELVL
jgi:hypothetical protein